MGVRVEIPPQLRAQAEGQTAVDLAGATVGDVLTALGTKFPALNQRIMEGGQVRRFINVYLNREDVRYLDNLATPVKDGDTLAIIPAVAGG
jgi:molybdopterin converting factor small subunit